MSREPSLSYVGAAFTASILAVVGVWLPWVRKIPGPDGAVTMEYVPGLWTGIESAGYDKLILLLIAVVMSITLLARYRQWRPDPALIAVGGFILFIAGGALDSYLGGYYIQPGLFILFLSGLLLTLLGVSAFVRHYSVSVSVTRST